MPPRFSCYFFCFRACKVLEPDEEVEAYWSNILFGTGSYKEGTATINDYFKEISGGRFWFNPILLGDNTTGVYSFRLDKDYSDAQGIHPGWPFFEHDYDMMFVMEELAREGLDINQFASEGINHENYHIILSALFTAPQKDRNPQWYTTSNILCIFPTYNTPQVYHMPLSSAADAFALRAHVNMDSVFGTIAHELAHTLGTVDVYVWGSYASDLMSSYHFYMPDPYYVSHINPYYKTLFGWITPSVVTEPGPVRLYPPTSDKYNPIIVRTDDPNQYYIIENRYSDKFDTGLNSAPSYFDEVRFSPASDGINIWRIDKLGCEAIYNRQRKGISLEAILRYLDSANLRRYVNIEDANDVQEALTGIIVTDLGRNLDGSSDVRIDF